MKKNCYPKVLRNLHLSTLVLNSGIMLLVVALLPLEVVETGENILSLLAQKVHALAIPTIVYGVEVHNQIAGRWLRILVVVDAIVVLCAGVLTGS
jgi:hypothetical protein